MERIKILSPLSGIQEIKTFSRLSGMQWIRTLSLWSGVLGFLVVALGAWTRLADAGLGLSLIHI